MPFEEGQVEIRRDSRWFRFAYVMEENYKRPTETSLLPFVGRLIQASFWIWPLFFVKMVLVACLSLFLEAIVLLGGGYITNPFNIFDNKAGLHTLPFLPQIKGFQIVPGYIVALLILSYVNLFLPQAWLTRILDIVTVFVLALALIRVVGKRVKENLEHLKTSGLWRRGRQGLDWAKDKKSKLWRQLSPPIKFV